LKRRWLIIATQCLLVLVILALLAAIWLPGMIRAHPNSAYIP
jgi:hypothetical protein